MLLKIVSGWSGTGGSSTANINLTNLFNANNIDCTFYGPHDWHLDKCKSGKLQTISIDPTDTVISHFIDPYGIKVRKHIYSCHEKQVRPLSNSDVSQYDVIHFINEAQKIWHSVDHPSVIIPNVYDDLVPGNKRNSSKGVAGVIGSLDANKQADVSIRRAFEKGYHTVLLFGSGNREYFHKVIKTLPEFGKTVHWKGYEHNKQNMYNSVEAVFLSSKSEVDPFVRGECHLTGTKFYGNEHTNNGSLPLDKSEILEKWIKVLE